MSISDVFNPIYFNSIFKAPTKANLKNEFIRSDECIQTNLKRINLPSKRTKNTPKTTTNNNMDLQHVIFLDWDDTLMPTSYLLSFIEYEIEINEKTKRKTIKTFAINGKCDEQDTKQFISNLNKAGNATHQLLLKIFTKFKPENVKIVTNGVNGWLVESLKVAGSFCKVYRKIYNLIFNQYHIDVFYARNFAVAQKEWKTKCFDKLLWRYFNGETDDDEMIPNINIITIGDQWCDHDSISQSLTYSIYGEYISHHQIKLFANPDCRYLCVELNYVEDLLDEQILFKFANFINTKPENQQGLVLEFDGYNNDN